MRVTVKSGILASLTRMLVTVTMLMMFSWLTIKVITDAHKQNFNFPFPTDLAMMQVSKMLDTLLVSSAYDSELRPGFEAGRVTRVKVNMAVTTLGPVMDDKGVLVLTCYLR